jgi:HAD superfamily hydrolase (TIGR01509 family)
MAPPKAVLFDVDGTLVDTVDLHARAWLDTFRHFGIEADFDEVRRQIGKGGDQLLPGLVPPALLAAKAEEMSAFRAELFKREYLPQVRPFPGVRALFERIHAAGQTIVLASSGEADEVGEHKRIANIADLVDDETTSSDAERSKPFPDIFEAAFAKLGLTERSDAVVIGDTPYDAEAARGAGLAAIGVLCGGFPERALREAGCVAVYRDPQHLLDEYEASPLATGLDAADAAA